MQTGIHFKIFTPFVFPLYKRLQKSGILPGIYSFSKGHSASYAVESFQSLFLKAYYPKEFMVGVINNFGGFYNTEFYVHEARMAGAIIHPPCINNSKYVTSIYGDDIYLGLIHLSGLEKNVALAIVEEREASGEYKGLIDFTQRVAIELEQLRILIRIGAFRFTGRTKKELLWDIYMLLGKEKKTEVRFELFETGVKTYQLPELTCNPIDDAHVNRIARLYIAVAVRSYERSI